MVTQNLKLIPSTPEHALALIDSSDSYTRAFGWPPAEGLRDYLVSDAVSPEWLAQLRSSTGPDPWRFGFALLHPASGTVVGMASFKGPPGVDGVVEIAYGVVPKFQGRGYATEVARALTDYAFGTGQVRLVCAHTAPEMNASTRVLGKCGFQFAGEVLDPVDGRIWRWERSLIPCKPARSPGT